MRHQLYAFACGAVFCLFLGCHPQGVAAPVTGASPNKFQTEMAKFAFLAYIGDALTGPYDQVEAELAGCVSSALEKHASNWTLAWGPVVYHFPIAELDDNMMYVVREKTDPFNIVVVVRGTDPPAIDDWLAEDFDVVDQVSWPAGSGQPKISKAISEGLHILQQLAPAKDPQATLVNFLTAEAVASSPGLRVNVTGHSLGGALAPTLALWLHDTQSTWDPQGKAHFEVYPLAGPTAGNAAFAAYYDSVFGEATYRMWNPFDVVPLAWNHESMGKMADLYEPFTRVNLIERGLIDGLRSLTRDKGYSQIDPTQRHLSGAVYTGKPGERVDWAAEAGWQHHCGYECVLGIRIDPAVFPECPSKRPKCDCTDVSTTASR
jgi:Lipase (class 3)